MENYQQIEETITTQILDNYHNGHDFSDKKEKDQTKFKCISKLVNYLFKYKSDKTMYKIVNNSINLVFSLYEDYPVDLYSGEMAYSENWLNKFNYFIYQEYQSIAEGRDRDIFDPDLQPIDSRMNKWRKEEMIKTIWRFHEEHDYASFCILSKK